MESVTVSSEASLQVVRTHFDQIKGSQWVLLANGMCDLETRRILTSMFITLVQTLSANVLGLIIPQQEVNHRFLSEEESTRAHRSITTVLQNTIGQVFSQALNLPTDALDKHSDSHELTALIEQEVSAKVNRVLSEKKEDGSISVDSLISSETVARSMIDKGNSCLQKCLRFLFCSCGRRASTKQSASSESGPCRCSFLRFAKKNFKSMQSNLETKLLSEELEPGRRVSSRGSGSSGSYPDLAISPGATLRTPEVSFEQFQPEVEELFQQLNLSTSPDIETSQERLTQALKSEQTTAFAQRLTDMMYCHFQIMDSAALAASPNPEIRRKLRNQDQELVYAMVRNEVFTYLHSFTHYIKHDPLDDFYQQDLFELCMERPPLSPNSQEALTYNVSIPFQGSVPVQVQVDSLSLNSHKHDLFERSMVHPRACVPSQISRDVPAIVLRTPEVRTNSVSAVSEHSFRSQKYDLFERSMAPPKVQMPSFISKDVPAIVLKTPENMQRLSHRSDFSEGQSMTLGLIESLMIEMFRGKAALRPWDKKYERIRDSLTQKAWEEIQLSEHQVKKTEKRMNKIIQAVIKDLKTHYGTAENMVERALDKKDPTFDKTVLKSLQYHLEHNLRKKRSLLSRVFRGLIWWCATIED
ncbi:unnamed protein product [Knipowitschia caucasica]|uniref:Uncharacterized protein n=1 Tax=Knipowitschia caucasica TaxID=637954 RepID=A0AAV2M478_KNICA